MIWFCVYQRGSIMYCISEVKSHLATCRLLGPHLCSMHLSWWSGHFSDTSIVGLITNPHLSDCKWAITNHVANQCGPSRVGLVSVVRDDRNVLLKVPLHSTFPLCLQQNDLKSTGILLRFLRHTATFRENDLYNINDPGTRKRRRQQRFSSKNSTKLYIKNDEILASTGLRPGNNYWIWAVS